MSDQHLNAKVQSYIWVLWWSLSGPGSVKDQIKLINEKFAGAAHLQGQEAYPSRAAFTLWDWKSMNSDVDLHTIAYSL